MREGCLQPPACTKVAVMPSQPCFNTHLQRTSPPPLSSYAIPTVHPLFQGGLGSAPLGANP